MTRGAFKSVQPKEQFISVVPDDPPTRLKVSVKPGARSGRYHVSVQGDSGPDFLLEVLVPRITPDLNALNMEETEIGLTAGKQETKLVPVVEGWATAARLATPVEGLTVGVENSPSTSSRLLRVKGTRRMTP